ncbi:MAG: ribonuclease P protein component [Polyangiales bacterium]
MPAQTDIAPATSSADLCNDQRLPREHRLLRRSEFVRVQQQGRRIHTAHFILLVMFPQPPHARGVGVRLGVTVGRRVGCAVRRNRIKRLVREVFRQNRALFPDHCDVVLVARPGADRLDYSSVVDELVRAQAAIERVRRQFPPVPAELQAASET